MRDHRERKSFAASATMAFFGIVGFPLVGLGASIQSPGLVMVGGLISAVAGIGMLGVYRSLCILIYGDDSLRPRDQREKPHSVTDISDPDIKSRYLFSRQEASFWKN